MEFARFLGLPPVRPRHNVTDITEAVCQVLTDARTDLVIVDEIHNLNLATSAGEDLSDHLKYFTEHLPATFIYAGIDAAAISAVLDESEHISRELLDTIRVDHAAESSTRRTSSHAG